MKKRISEHIILLSILKIDQVSINYTLLFGLRVIRRVTTNHRTNQPPSKALKVISISQQNGRGCRGVRRGVVFAYSKRRPADATAEYQLEAKQYPN